jgi:hypothetical protein
MSREESREGISPITTCASSFARARKGGGGRCEGQRAAPYLHTRRGAVPSEQDIVLGVGGQLGKLACTLATAEKEVRSGEGVGGTRHQ